MTASRSSCPFLSRACYAVWVTFGEYLQQALKAADLSRRAFGKKVGYHASNIDKVIQGKRPPPLKRIPGWLKELSKHVESDKFKELAALAHCPAEIQREFMRMRRELEKR